VDVTGWPSSERVNSVQSAVVVVAVLVVAALAWMLTDERMAGMDDGPGTDPGSLGFYVSLWVVMMAAMMLPSAAPMVAVHAAVERRRRYVARSSWGGSAAFVVGYLLVWTAFGVVAYAIVGLVGSLDVDSLSWSRGGRYVAAGVIAVAAVYQLTPLKDVCRAKCRSPLAFVVGSWRDGRLGAARMGMEQGSWCVGCCWALMATLFALGLMSIGWMAVIAVLVALEKLLPWGRLAGRGVALVLAGLALAVALGVF
jgi:predicted metal-binding membrane protein